MENIKQLGKITAWVFGTVLVVTLLGTLLSTQPWRPSPSNFRTNDPHGYSACSSFEHTDGAGGETYSRAIGVAASEAAQSSNGGIRDAVDDGSGERDGAPVITDLGDFRKACTKAGYRFN